MVGQHHQPNGHKFEQAVGDGEGQGSWRAAVRGFAKSQTGLSDRQQQNAAISFSPTRMHKRKVKKAQTINASA